MLPVQPPSNSYVHSSLCCGFRATLSHGNQPPSPSCATSSLLLVGEKTDPGLALCHIVCGQQVVQDRAGSILCWITALSATGLFCPAAAQGSLAQMLQRGHLCLFFTISFVSFALGPSETLSWPCKAGALSSPAPAHTAPSSSLG